MLCLRAQRVYRSFLKRTFPSRRTGPGGGKLVWCDLRPVWLGEKKLLLHQSPCTLPT